MYPNPGGPPPPPPGHKSEYDQYPLQDTQFAPQPVERMDPFADPYPDQQRPAYDNQPLLRDPPQPFYPPDNSFHQEQPQQPGGSPSPRPAFVAPPSPNMHYGGAPRRQPRRYKTSKFVVRKSEGVILLS